MKKINVKINPNLEFINGILLTSKYNELTKPFIGYGLMTEENNQYTNAIKEFFRKYEIENSIVSSVSFSKREIVSFLEKKSNFIDFDLSTPFDLKINYETPHTLGKDRIAAAVGALKVMPQNDLLIVDIGSCVTFDLVTKNRTFHGGNIAPGFYMRLNAMHDYTAKLPVVKQQLPKNFIGKTTQEAILNGAFWGIVFEIDSLFEQLKKDFPDIQAVLTGGDSLFFANSIKQCNFVDSNLVLLGLNEIINKVIKN